MSFTTINNYIVARNFINEAMFVSDSSRPASCKFMLQRLWFSKSFKWVSYFFKSLDIINRPVVIIVKSFCFKNKSFHFLPIRFSFNLSNFSSVKETTLPFSTLFIALLIRAIYSSFVSVLFKPKSVADDTVISISRSFLNNDLIYFNKINIQIRNFNL